MLFDVAPAGGAVGGGPVGLPPPLGLNVESQFKKMSILF